MFAAFKRVIVCVSNCLGTLVSVFTIKRPKGASPWRLNGEDTEHMYS